MYFLETSILMRLEVIKFSEQYFIGSISRMYII
jgi:hypothetical protein